jgi:hypothetical protein
MDYFKLLKIVKIFSNNDNLWISFVEGLHRHAAIVMCLTCSTFDLQDNKLVHNCLKKKEFRLVGVPHYKETDMSPIQVLNSIIKAEFDAPMLTNHIQVQSLHPKNKKLEIDPSMTLLKQMSMWISTNKKLFAEPTISKWLAEDLTEILSLSTPDQRRKFCPNIHDKFGYQNDVDMRKFERMCRKDGEKSAAQYLGLLISEEYTNTNYSKDPFKKERTLAFLSAKSPHQTMSGHRFGGFYPPYGITYESLTSNVRIVAYKSRKSDVRHFNAYLFVPRLVYKLSTKLKKEAMFNRIGKSDKVKLIKFLIRYGYATRAAPFCKLHSAYARYTSNINNLSYINNCNDWNRIIPVTVFLVMLFNACLMY